MGEQHYLSELNESQQAAVLYNDGPALVIAGAGSGKTRVLTYKIAYLLEQGYEPWSILALTFTNKAAREMQQRIGKQVGMQVARHIWMGTFHSLFTRILRREAHLLGYPYNFTIYDASDSKSLLKSIIKEMGLNEKDYKPGAVQRAISNAKNQLVTAEMYEQSTGFRKADSDAKMPQIYAIYKRHSERCKQSGAMDFDDLLLYTFILLKEYPEVCEQYASQFKYILVDEYQDTNHAQHCIVLLLSSVYKKVCVVGDDAQSIYSFRGANIDNILKFTKLFDDTKLFKLEQNYRSTQNIVNAANSVISKNRFQIEKAVFSKKSEGEPLRIIPAVSGIEEGENIGNLISKMKRSPNSSYDDFAILYRTNAQSRIMEEVLRRKEIPYFVYGGLSFYQRKEIKDVIAYFRMAINPHDEEAFKRIINTPARGIGNTTLSKIRETATLRQWSMWDTLKEENLPLLKVNKGTMQKLSDFRNLIEEMIEVANKKTATEATTFIIGKSQIMQEYIASTALEDINRKENIYELANGVELFCNARLEEGDIHISLADYLSEVSLLTDLDENATDDSPRVTLMTIHSAKGLEFKHVFIIGLEEGLFPSPQSTYSQRQLEEERRLFYVAITRAEETCILSYAKCRQLYGHTDYNPPSRFLHDIDPSFLEHNKKQSIEVEVLSRAKTFSASTSLPSMPRLKPLNRVKEDIAHSPTCPTQEIKNAIPGLSEGTRIRHERFGEGTIVKIEGKEPDTKVLVSFDTEGEKQLLLKYARFIIID